MARARSKTQKTAPTKLAAQFDNQAIITRHPVQDQMSIGEKSRLHSLACGQATSRIDEGR